MKTIKLLIVLLITYFGYSCSDEEDSLKKFISDNVEISDIELIIPSGRVAERTIITSDVTWTLEGGDSWCSYEPKTGGAGTTIVNFTLEPNMEYDDRSVNITLTAGGKKQTLTVYQKKKDAIILSRDKFDNIGMEGDEITVDLQTNINYRIEIPAKSAAWISLLPEDRNSGWARGLENKTMSFKIEPTQDESARVGEIIFMSVEDEKLRDTVHVYQVQRDVIVLSRPENVVPLEGMTLKIDIRSNVVYDVEIPQDIDWVRVDPGLGRSPRVDRLLLKIDEYDGESRNCLITVRDRNNPTLFTELKILQIDQEIIVIEDSEFIADRVLTASREEGTYTLNISDNINGRYELFIPNHAKWIQATPVTLGLTTGSLQIRLTENPIDKTQRMAKIFVRGIDNHNTIDTLTIVQAGGIEADLDERRIIYEIAVALDFENWPEAYKNAWSMEKPIEEWSNGVKTRDGKVVELIFPANGNGQISPKIGELVHLENLGFGGTFGSVVGCRVSGPVPPEIGKLSNLKKLSLKGDFTLFPPELGGLESLEDLTLNFAFYDAIDVIGELKNLKRLTITTGFAGQMSENWSNLKNLEYLSISSGEFTTIDPIVYMTSLKTLSLDNFENVRGVLPAGIGYLTNLESLTITKCSFTDLCTSMGALVKLRTLKITNNNLNFIPEDIGGCSSLTSFDMRNNGINGTIPESIGNLVNVTTFYLMDNQLTGTIPASIGNLVKAQYIELQNNQLTGTIPSTVGALRAVRTFNLSNNQLTGISPEIGNMFAVRTLNLSKNRMEGSIPSLGKLTAMTSLDLSHNLFSGPIPMDWHKDMTGLQTVKLDNNNLEGEIPSTFGLLPKLYYLHLDSNKLEGSIPLTLFNATTLRDLYLQSNRLSGEIPVNFANFKLNNLDLRHNNLEGTIPVTILGQANSFSLKASVLHLSGNRLTGTIPSELWRKMEAQPNWSIREQQNGVVLDPPAGQQ